MTSVDKRQATEADRGLLHSNSTRAHRRLRRRLIVFGIAIVGLLVIALLATRTFGADDPASSQFLGLEVAPPRTLPALTLQHTDNSEWSSESGRGRLSLYFFGYTHCPDICPLTLSRARQVREQLGEQADEVDVYFITVDPERDTPERLRLYVSQFHPSFMGLTGGPEQIDAAKLAFGVVAEKHMSSSASGYSVDHTATSFLVNRENQIVLLYPHDVASSAVVSDIQGLLDADDV